MELLLNLLWLALLLPAVLIWRSQSVCSGKFRHPCGLRAIILLGCLLVLLFPVVSATDDLHPVRNEMEESSPSRRAVKQAPGPQAPDWGNFGRPAAQLVEVSWVRPRCEPDGLIAEYSRLVPERLLAATSVGRSPPAC